MKDIIGDGEYCIFTYSDEVFKRYTNQIIDALGKPKLIINNILPNPDYKNFKDICKSFCLKCSNIKFAIAFGGGSVIDTAKISGFEVILIKLSIILKKSQVLFHLLILILFLFLLLLEREVSACWATIWDEENQRKHSLIHPCLFSKLSIFDSEFTLSLQRKLLSKLL